MKINELIDSFDAMTPTEEKKEKMLSEILRAENKKAVRIFDLKRAGMTVVGLAAAIALAVSVHNFGGFKTPDNGTYVAQVTDEEATDKQGEELPQSDMLPKTEKKTETKNPADRKRTEVAQARPVSEPNTEITNDVTELAPQPRVSGGGSGAARSTENIQGAAGNADSNANAGIALASEEMYNESTEGEAASEEVMQSGNEGIAVVSEKDAENEVEWITVPSMEDVSDLEENVGIEGETDKDEKAEDEEEDKEENNE